MAPFRNMPEEALKPYALTQETFDAAPAWTHDEANALYAAVWNATGRHDDAVNCFPSRDPFRCLLRMADQGRAARIGATPNYRSDVLIGWGVSVAPDHTKTIFKYAKYFGPHDHGYTLQYFKCEQPATFGISKMREQRLLCSKPHFGLDKQ